MTKYEDVKHLTNEEYFNGNQFSIDAFNKKYASLPGQTYVNRLWEICTYIASAEKTEELKKYWAERWFDEMFNDYWHCAGSIMQGANLSRKISLQNCTTIDIPEDSIEAIIKYSLYRTAKTAAYRQGLGLPFDVIRPKGMKLSNSANESEGVLHWMKLFDSIGYYVGQKGRIPAMLMSLIVTHPDIEDFIRAKGDYGVIQNANISVQNTDAFYEAVLANKNYDLVFEVPEIKIGDKIYLNPEWDDMRYTEGTDDSGSYYISKTYRPYEKLVKSVNARKILELIAQMMTANAEPGVQNIDIARKFSNSDYVGFPIKSTNACSEQYLNPDGNCNLSSHNAIKASCKYLQIGEIEDLDYKLIEKCAESQVRFLDNVVSKELEDGKYATIDQKRSLEYLRRIGIGFTNLGGLLFKEGFEYGSKEGNDLIEKYAKICCYYAYKASIALGKEKGSFLAFDRDKYIKSPFIQNLMKEFPDLDFEYMRNVCVISIAPTGTLSLMFREMVESYGIEKGFGTYFWKRTRISGKYEYYFCVPAVIREMFYNAGYPLPMDSDTLKDDWKGTEGKKIVEFMIQHAEDVGISLTTASSVNVYEKLDLMARVQKWVDSSISVTYTLPEGSDWKDTYNLILEGWKKGVKSLSAYPEKKMYGIVSSISFKDLAFKLKSEGVFIHPQNFDEVELEELNISSDNIEYKAAPKRPKILEADIYIRQAKGQKFIIAIGLLNGAPFEIFCGHLNGLDFKFEKRKGKIIRIGKGKYDLEIENMIYVENFSKHFTPVENALFRSVSGNLRHGMHPSFIIDFLDKESGDITSLLSVAARVLKIYLAKGEIAKGIKCPGCHNINTLTYDEGCLKCSVCNYSKCS